MTGNEWTMLLCLLVGWLQGFAVAWTVFRYRNLKYKGVDNERKKKARNLKRFASLY